MFYPFKKIRIAVVGTVSSGKSFLLYDIIHAFSVLGYHPVELPLSYPHSSFGAFFYDNFNAQTGGMIKTDGLCRPENHYGVHLSGNYLPMALPVDFLNIPGEVFEDSETRIDFFFKMKRLIEDCTKDIFYLSKWKSPSGRVVKLIVPDRFGRDRKASSIDQNGCYVSLENILYDLDKGGFKEKSREKVNGKYIFKHITELNIDSLIQTLELYWAQIKDKSGIEWSELLGKQVIKYFYPLAYCYFASDMILCDKLDDSANNNILKIEKSMVHFFDYSKSVNRHIYFAFRAVDTIIQKKQEWHQVYRDMLNKDTSIGTRNRVYSEFLTHLQQPCENKDKVLKNVMEHIMISVGSNFRTLLNYAYHRATDLPFLLPHVYFTATPIDINFSIYENDTEDVTRFYYEDKGRNQRKSFTGEIYKDMSRHMCFGSLQLLTDILLQNRALPMWHDALRCRDGLLKGFQC